MGQLRSMHQILDVVEDMVREACRKPEEWERVERQLYMLDTPVGRVPAGFGEDDDDGFDAFAAALGASTVPESGGRAVS